jgi:DNA-binding CsgD family transcriptional regulator
MVGTETEKSSPITPRQREVVALIAAGLSNDEVGARLGISSRTAKAHSDVLRQKLGVSRRRQIPIAFLRLTGEDPLAQSLGVGGVPARAPGGRRGPRTLVSGTAPRHNLTG